MRGPERGTGMRVSRIERFWSNIMIGGPDWKINRLLVRAVWWWWT
jgi:hypothetical protein